MGVFVMDEQYMTIKQVSKYLKRSESMVRNYIRRGELTPIKGYGRGLFNRHQVEALHTKLYGNSVDSTERDSKPTLDKGIVLSSAFQALASINAERDKVASQAQEFIAALALSVNIKLDKNGHITDEGMSDEQKEAMQPLINIFNTMYDKAMRKEIPLGEAQQVYDYVKPGLEEMGVKV
jgi:Helix-turn-helix domain